MSEANMDKTVEGDLDEAVRKKRGAAATATVDRSGEDAAPGGRRKYRPRHQDVRAKPSLFISKFELAHHLQCSVSSLKKWIADGEIPPPYTRIGDKHPVWLRSHFDGFVKTTRWPQAAWEARA